MKARRPRSPLPFVAFESCVVRLPTAHLPRPAGFGAAGLGAVAHRGRDRHHDHRNLAAITQSNIKRLLAYSSISHAGYMLLGLIAGNATGIKGISVYVMVYTF